MNVKLILDRKGRDVATAAPTAQIVEITKILAERRIGAVVLTGADDRLVGIVSERDVVRALAIKGPAMLTDPVSTIMTRGVVTCTPDERVDEIMRKMTEGKFRHIPVVAEGRLAGIISIGDVVKQRMTELEAETNAMRDYIVMG